jgi:hypothetical protein
MRLKSGIEGAFLGALTFEEFEVLFFIGQLS